MGKKVLLILIAVLLLLAVTCPKREDHKDAIKDALVEDDIGSTNALAFLGIAVKKGIMNLYLGSHLKIHNFIFFNVGVIKDDGKNKVVSIGLLNHVYTAGFNEDIK